MFEYFAHNNYIISRFSKIIITEISEKLEQKDQEIQQLRNEMKELKESILTYVIDILAKEDKKKEAKEE